MPRKMLSSLLIAFAATGCSSSAPIHPREICPPLIEWSKNDSDALAYEIDKFHKQTPMMTRAIGELFLLRRQCRDTDKEKKNEND